MGRMVRIKNIGVQSVIEKQENCSSGGITDSVPPTPVVLHDTVYLEVFVVSMERTQNFPLEIHQKNQHCT